MKAGTVLLILRDVVDHMVTVGYLLPDGSFANLSVANDLDIASTVEQSLKRHGVTVPEDVDRVMHMLPLILPMFGVK